MKRMIPATTENGLRYFIIDGVRYVEQPPRVKIIDRRIPKPLLIAFQALCLAIGFYSWLILMMLVC